jgi:hypothetical protein
MSAIESSIDETHNAIEIRWREFNGSTLDQVVEPRAFALLPTVRRKGRLLMMGIRFTRMPDGKLRGDCRALWKSMRA